MWKLIGLGISMFAVIGFGRISWAEGSPVAQEGCRRCDQRGVVPCDRHPDHIHEAEGRVLFCSVIADCPDCLGALFVDCEHCASGPQSEAVAARRAAIAAWAAKSPVVEHFGRNVPRCETEHFEIVLDVTGKFKNGKKKIDAHTLMHLVADDCVHVGRGIDRHFDAKPRDYKAKMRMWMWPTGEDHKSAVEHFMETSARGDFKLLGRDPVFSVWQEPGQFTRAPGIRSLFAHNAGHMLISNMLKELDISPHGGGWFDAGAAHWYEYDRFEKSTNYCIEEASAPVAFSRGIWRAAMRKLVQASVKAETSLFLPLLRRTTTSMNPKEQAICWSFYDWIVTTQPEKLRPLLKGLKAKRETRDLFVEHLGVNVLDAETGWRIWVLETYPKKEKLPRRGN